MTLIFRWWLPFANKLHTSSEWTTANRLSTIMRPLLLFKVLWYNFVKTNVVPYFTNLLYGQRCSVTVTPDYSTIENMVVAQRIEDLHETNIIWWFTGICRTTDNTGEWMFKPQIITITKYRYRSVTLIIHEKRVSRNRTWPNYYGAIVLSWKMTLYFLSSSTMKIETKPPNFAFA